MEPKPAREGHLGGQNPPERPPLLARPGGLYPPGGPADDPPDTIKSHYSREKIKEKELS